MLTIKVPKPQDLQAVLAKAKRDIETHDISWVGDSQQGQCSSRGFEGSYVVDADYITVTLTKKPLWVTKARIEQEVKKYLAQ